MNARSVRLALLGFAISISGCSGASDLPESPVAIGGASGPCDVGATRPCGLELGSDGSSITCARGNQLCRNGSWGACMPDAALGTTRVRVPSIAAPLGGGLHVFTVGGSATQCTNNPCDPGCQIFDDVPDAAFRAKVTDGGTAVLTGGSLAQSNVPQGFQNKGNDQGGVCRPGCTSQACEQACQYDQRCSSTQNGKCEAFGLTEKAACTGVDITAGVTCETPDGKYRVLFVCNRGTADAPPGISCWAFPGNSQHMPAANQDTSGATLIATTQGTIKPGSCESIPVSNTHPPFDSNGAQELLCNVPGTAVVTFGVGPNFPSTNAAGLSGEASWSTPTGAYAVNAPYASAPLVDPNGATTGPLFPTSNAAVGTDATWTSRENGQAADLVYATASPSMPTVTTGSVASNPTTDDQGLGKDAYTSDGAFASATISTKAGSLAIAFAGFDETSLPPTAALTSVDIQVVWKADKTTHTMEADVGAFVGTTAVSSTSKVTFNGNSPTTPYTQQLLGLTSITASDLRNSGFKVEVTFVNNNKGSTAITASVDYVLVTANWSNSASTSSVAYGNFGFGGRIPAAATITSLAIETKWKASVSTADAELEFGAYSGGSLVAGTDFTETSPPTTPTVRSISASSPGLTGAGLADGTLQIVVHASRLLNGGTSTPFMAYLDYVKVTAGWTVGAGKETYGALYGGFGFNIPANATISQITTEASWRLSSSTLATFGLQAYDSGAALGTETTDTSKPTGFVTISQALTGAALGSVTPADLNGGNFQVHARVSR